MSLLAAGLVASANSAHRVVFSCNTDEGTWTLALKYNGSAGNVIRAERIDLSAPGEAIIRIQAYQNTGSGSSWQNKWKLEEDIAETYTDVSFPQGGEAWFNTRTDNYKAPNVGDMRMLITYGLGSNNSCYSYRDVTAP